jgi:hypothetical protein
MKIAIGVNIFKENKNQLLAIECLKRIKANNKNVEIYNIAFEEELVKIQEFINLGVLTKSSIDLTGNKNVKKPVSNELFDILSSQDCDYFLFVNSDILVSQKTINIIKKAEYETYIFSRHEIKPISNINEPISPYKIEVAGFDGWAIKNDWWKQNKKIIPECIYSEVAWDNIMSLSIFPNSKSILCNKDFYIGHITHTNNWSRETPEGQYNMKTWMSMPISQKWNYYLQSVLFKRQPFVYFTQPLINEERLEKQILK